MVGLGSVIGPNSTHNLTLSILINFEEKEVCNSMINANISYGRAVECYVFIFSNIKFECIPTDMLITIPTYILS